MGGDIVSVLFTDLVGSTELLDRLGDDAAEPVRQAHFRLLREVVKTRRGHEVKNLGDGLMVVFPSAVDALGCAVAIQQAVRRHNRPGLGASLHVRVGVHVGEPIRDEGDYFGTTVTVAKRLCDRAAADQILTSQLVVDLVGSRRAFAFRSVGPLQLKGIVEPVPAAAVEWENDAADDEPAPLEYRVLGPIEVRGRDDAVVPLTSARQRLLLACLLANAGQVVSADRLVEALWPDGLPADPQDALQSQISRLRRRLGSAPIETTPAGYRFTAVDRLDVTLFERLVDDGRRSGDPLAELDAWDAALSLWRGRAFFDVADHPELQPAAARLDRLRTEVAEARVETLLRLGRAVDGLTAAEMLRAEEPYRERPVELCMRALAASGRAVDALRTYEAFRRRLAEDVGLDPSPELRAIEGQILRQERHGAATGPAGSGPAADIPVATTSFVGRRDTVAKVTDALGASRLVTVTGPGGIGKTRLALETAHRVADGFAAGASLCELGPVGDVTAVSFALAAAVGVRQAPDATIEESLVRALATRELLVVVDNCEHVIEGIVPLLEQVLARCPGVRVLATSRERLAANGETVVEIAPLDVPEAGIDPATAWDDPADALQLLCDRVTAIRPGFSPGGLQQAALVDIAHRLDGLPLALELAAARVATMGAVEVAARLDDPFGLLTRGRRSAPDRHRTLRATVEWSYRLLDEPERRTFESACVFAGGFTLAAAEGVCGVDGHDDVADVISALADKSMIVVDDRGSTTRYRLLETLRQFGRERLADTGRLAAIEEAHARYFAALVWEAEPQLRGPAEAEWVGIVQAELPNLRAARAWAMRSGQRALAAEFSAALFWFTNWRTQTEIMGWAEELADDEPGLIGRSYARMLATAGAAAWRRGDLRRGQALGERIIALAGDEPSARYGWQLVGVIAALQGRLAEAGDAFRRMGELARRDGDHHAAAHAFALLALTQSYAGDTAAAIATAGVNRVEAVRSGAPSVLAYNAYTLGELLAPSEPDQALAHLDRAIALSDTVGAHFIHGIAMVSATSLRVRHSAPAIAASALIEVIDHWERAGHWRQQWTTLRQAVELFARVADDEAAAVMLGAIDAHDTGNVFGADADRLAAVRADVQRRLGRAAERCVAEGGSLEPAEVVAFARRRLAEHAAGDPRHSSAAVTK
jgi:predicted ATPase/class 3 adenylate cyclase/DNA-binding SARP family transcriptional activator